jgi:N-terminal domain of anti-restriction factor ArdC
MQNPTADEKGYAAGTWGTYRQWAEAGAQIRKGEKPAHIVLYKEITVAADEPDSDWTEVPDTVSLSPADGAARIRDAPAQSTSMESSGASSAFPFSRAATCSLWPFPPSGAATTATALPLLDLLDFETATGWRSVAD